MLNFAIDNETVKAVGPIPFLTDNFIYRRYDVMAKNSIPKTLAWGQAPKECIIDGCNNKHIARGYCIKHYNKIKRSVGFQPIAPRGCKVEGCDGKHHAHGYCCKHSHQIKRHGEIKERTRKDPNDFSFEGDICKIQIFDGDGNHVASAVIDADDYKLVRGYKWGINNFGYPICWKFDKSYRFLHHQIIGVPKGNLEVDHRDGNPLNNRKDNLRFATSSQNKMNIKVVRGKSKYKGVHKKGTKYKAVISANNQAKQLGTFSNECDAAIAYDDAAKKLFGEFAVTNENMGLI